MAEQNIVPHGVVVNEEEDEHQFPISSFTFARWVIPNSTLETLEKDEQVPTASKATLAASKKIHHAFALSGGATLTAFAPHLVSTPKTGGIVVADKNYKAGSLPGQIIRQDPPASSPLVGNTARELDGNAAFDHSKTVREFYKTILGRDSIDGKGLTLISTIRYDRNFLNAFWNGEQMVYGSPDEGQPLRNFAQVLDIAGHEMSHGVVQYTVNFIYYGQAGALNESVADCFGVSISQRFYQNEEWGIGKIFTANPDQPLRQFDDPSKGYPPQPAHFRDFKKLPFDGDGDNGGVHTNSGIPNHAFYLVTKYLKEKSYGKPIVIWYKSLQPNPEWKLNTNDDLGKVVRLTDLDGATSVGRRTTFAQWAARTVKVAGLLYDQETADGVKKAWVDVGVL